MLKIEMSPQYIKDMMPGLFRLTGGSNRDSEQSSGAGLLNTGYVGIQGYSGVGRGLGAIWLMKGNIPTSFIEITTLSGRMNDALCKFHTTNIAADFSPCTVDNNPVNIATVYKTAIASGLATWFWWHVAQSKIGSFSTYEDYIDTSANLLHCIYGSVGLVTSGADLEMEDTNIVAGQDYRISDLPIRFPTTWSY